MPKYTANTLVKIKAHEDIASGLDPLNHLDGCLMMEQMWRYCGQEHKIIKVVDHFFDEYRQKMFKAGKPFYILENLICEGTVDTFNYKCDRSCYFLWHEDWLDKA